MTMQTHYFPNIGYISDDVPENLLARLKKIVNEKNLEKHNMDLAGNIRKEFKIPKALGYFEGYIIDLCKKYDEEFNYVKTIKVTKQAHPFFLESMWVNFQKKHEFNPIHIHSGVFSFVIWLQVPFTKDEEKKSSPGAEGNTDQAGAFQFHYSDALGSLQHDTHFVDKEWQGKIFLFPALLSHSVSPFFSSDDYRISVSGNVLIDV